MGFDDGTDFEELVSRIRTQSGDASGSNTERVAYRSFEELDVDALRTLREEFDDGDADPAEAVFVLSTANAESLLETADADALEELEEGLGHEIRGVDRMPDDTLLLLDPEAIDGAEVTEPTAIVCGMIGSADEPNESE